MAELTRFDPPAEATAQEALQHVAVRNRMLAMVRRGATPGQVVEVMGRGDEARGIEPVHLSEEDVRTAVKAYLEQAHKHDTLKVEELRVLENERLDTLQSALETELRFRGDDGEQHLNLKVADRLIKISERRAKMNGLDAPEVLEHRVGDGLRELGILAEHVERAEQAFKDTFTARGLEDVVDVEGEEIHEPVGP